jgi:hypothetical protein
MGDDNEEVAEFNFEKWTEDNSLNSKTTGILRSQDLDKLEALQLLEPDDLLPLGLTTGQRRLTLPTVCKLQKDNLQVSSIIHWR